MTRVPLLLFGAGGRMGRAIRASLPEFPEIDLRACVSRRRDDVPCPPGCSWLEPKEMLSGAADRMPEDLVVVDVSLPQGTAFLLDWLERSPRALVSATTGLSETLEARIRLLAARAPVLRARNMSLGNLAAAAMLAAIPGAAREAFQIDIVEHHHAAKRDAPSGTAIAWADLLSSGHPERVVRAPFDPVAPRAPGEVRIHSVRAGTVPGTHRALFAGSGETLELVHTVSDRAVFARGALRAARFVHGRAARAYSFEDVLSQS